MAVNVWRSGDHVTARWECASEPHDSARLQVTADGVMEMDAFLGSDLALTIYEDTPRAVRKLAAGLLEMADRMEQVQQRAAEAAES